MQTITLTRKDFKETPEGLVYENDFSCYGNLKVEKGLNVKFVRSLEDWS